MGNQPTSNCNSIDLDENAVGLRTNRDAATVVAAGNLNRRITARIAERNTLWPSSVRCGLLVRTDAAVIGIQTGCSTKGVSAMDRVIRVVETTCRAAAVVSGAAIVALMLHVTADVTLRTVANSPIPGTLETVAYWWMVTIVFLGIAYTKVRNEHIAVDLLPDRLPDRQRAVVRIGLEVVTIGVLLVLAYYGWEAAMSAMERGQRAVGITPILVWPFRFLLPLGEVLMISACVAAVMKNLKTIRPERKVHP